MEKKRFGVGIFVVLFNKEFSKILLVKRNEEKRKKWGADWGNVGGKLEFGEYSADACVREAAEEIGIKLDPKKIKLMEVKERPNFYEDVHGFHFAYAGFLDETAKIKINDEADEYKWFNLNDLPESMLDPKEELIAFAEKAKKLFKIKS